MMNKGIIKNVIAGFTVTGTVFVALALIVILGIIVGSSLNEIREGIGNLSLIFSGIAFFVLMILAIFIVFFK